MPERNNQNRGFTKSNSPRRSGNRTGRSNDRDTLESGLGASDGSSGGGAAAGIPDGDSDLRSNPKPIRDGDVERDRQKLFPEAKSHRRQGE